MGLTESKRPLSWTNTVFLQKIYGLRKYTVLMIWVLFRNLYVTPFIFTNNRLWLSLRTVFRNFNDSFIMIQHEDRIILHLRSCDSCLHFTSNDSSIYFRRPYTSPFKTVYFHKPLSFNLKAYSFPRKAVYFQSRPYTFTLYMIPFSANLITLPSFLVTFPC